MTPTEVLKMLKSKIDAAGLNKCNYAIETSDIEAINQALLLYDVSNSVCDCCVPRPEDPFEYDNPICEKCGLPIKQTDC